MLTSGTVDCGEVTAVSLGFLVSVGACETRCWRLLWEAASSLRSATCSSGPSSIPSRVCFFAECGGDRLECNSIWAVRASSFNWSGWVGSYVASWLESRAVIEIQWTCERARMSLLFLVLGNSRCDDEPCIRRDVPSRTSLINTLRRRKWTMPKRGLGAARESSLKWASAASRISGRPLAPWESTSIASLAV